MKSITKKAVFLLSAFLIVVLAIVPCFASRGDITTTSIKGEWELRYKNNTDSKVLEPYTFVCTEEIAQHMSVQAMPNQIMSEHSGEFGYREIVLYLDDWGTTWEGVAYYTGSIGTREFDCIRFGYTYPEEDLSPVGQNMTLSCVILGIGINMDVVDYVMVMLNYDHVVWSNVLERINFTNDYKEIQIDNGNIATINQVMKLFGTNAFGGAVLNTGIFVPLGTDPVPPTSDALESFIELVFDTLTNILSIEFFGWFTIGALVAVFVAISAVLLFLKYFAGG